MPLAWAAGGNPIGDPVPQGRDKQAYPPIKIARRESGQTMALTSGKIRVRCGVETGRKKEECGCKMQENSCI